MNKVIVILNNQTLFDVALQEYGSVEAVFTIVKNNTDIITSITDDIVAGTRLRIKGEVIKPEIVDYYAKNGVKPTSNFTENDVVGGDFNNDFNDDFL